jgi:hypothetical protein
MPKKNNNAKISDAGRCNPADRSKQNTEFTMPEIPKHKCAQPRKGWIGFAPIDLDVTTALAERAASCEEVYAQVRAWIRSDAAKHPNRPAESTEKRFYAALLSNIPFAVYCGLCLEVICLIQPEQVK